MASALAPSFEALVTLRFLAGCGIGGNMPCAMTLFSEFLTREARGRLMQLVVLCSPLGLFTVGLAQVLLLDAMGWRWLVAILSVPSALSLACAGWLHESPRWLLLQGQGNVEGARRVLRSMHPTGHEAQNIEPVMAALARLAQRDRNMGDVPHSIWEAGMRHITAVLWAVWVLAEAASASLGVWLPTILLSKLT